MIMPLPLSDDDQPISTGLNASGLPLQRVIIDGATPQPADLPNVGNPAIPDGGQFSAGNPTLNSVLDKLLGTNGQDRYQLWPERLIREALAAPHDAMNTTTPVTSADLIKPAMDVSALAGTGGLAGAGEEAGAATLGSSPFLRPALKYQGKIYKAPVGGQHMDAIPKDLQPEFTRQAMNGEDITNFNFGFMNHKGQFMSREDALKYAIDNGLVSQHDAKFGALTSTLMADSGKEAAAIDAISKQPFYSTLEKNVADIGQSKMTGDQWLGTLSNRPGVKPEEMQYTGLQDFLASKGKEPVTKAEVQAHLNDNKVELVEKNSHTPNPQLNRMLELDAKARRYEAEGETDAARAIRDQIKAIPNTGDFNPRYKDYQLPGGENYREKLLTLPAQNKMKWERTPEGYLSSEGYTIKKEPDGYITYGSSGRRLSAHDSEDMAKSLVETSKSNSPNTNIYRSSHWDEPNILAHMRMNDRDVGGKPSFHIEEIQSDWHQQGRDKGYRGEQEKTLSDLLKQRSEVHEKLKQAAIEDSPDFDKYSLQKKEIQAKIDKLGSADVGVPDAPFKKSWPELAMKRAIRMAVEEGKDRVSWTPGEAQAARYDLSKSVDKIHYNKELRTVVAYKNNKDVISRSKIDPKDLPDIIGKEAADKLLNNPTRKAGNTHELSGQDLKIGGEGMKGFYDQMLPNIVEKLGKKYGVKVKEGEASKAQTYVDQFGKTKYEPAKVKYFDIPEKMKQDVLRKGFPLFSNPLPVIPQSQIK